jgi:hypothetical protein
MWCEKCFHKTLHSRTVIFNGFQSPAVSAFHYFLWVKCVSQGHETLKDLKQGICDNTAALPEEIVQ